MNALCGSIAVIAVLGAAYAGEETCADTAQATRTSSRPDIAVATPSDAANKSAGTVAAGPSRALPALDGCRWIPEAPATGSPPRLTVIDLWGPWSSESMNFMPRLSRIARERAAEGVVVRGITREMPGYPAERIEEHVRRLGGRVTYPIGIAPAELHASVVALCGSGPEGVSDGARTLIVDSAGTVVAACSPAELEHTISRMLAGTWTGPHEIDSLRREMRAMDSLVKISMTDPALAVSQVDDMIAMLPHRTRDFASRRIVILLRAGRADDAAAAMRAATDEWTRLQDAAELTALATLWMDSRMNASGRDLRMAADAAEAAANISGDLDPNPWLLLMRARMAAGDNEAARAAGERAMAMADDRMRGRVAQLLAKIPKQPEGEDGTRQRAD